MSKPQRRKGNAKNASSSAAHAYLSEGGASFVGLTPEMNIFQMPTSNAEVHSHVNDECRIILRKLVKKDSSTREKGIRELMTFLEKNEEAIETSFEHFLGIFEQMATDGSATARMLTMKIANFLLKKLKKAAAKGMKKIIPMVFYQLSDSSNSVASAAETLLRENFSTEKRAVAFEFFGPIAIEKCVEIALGQHDLCQPAKYDEDESVEQRKYRLEVQALNTIQKIAGVLREKEEIWVERVRKLYEDAGFLKKTLGSDKPNLKVAVITLCLQLPNHTEIILNSPISQWILTNLDSENGQVCEACWNAFVVLLTDEKYIEQVSVQKTIIPRILNVIRKKKVHWMKMSSHILPAIASIFGDEHLAAENAPKILTIVESYPDNMPFEASVPSICGQHWVLSFSEVVKWVLSKFREVQGVEEKIATLIVKTITELINISEAELSAKIAELILWIFEKNAISDSSAQRLCQVVEGVVMENREKSEKFARKLLESGEFWQLWPMHSSVLNHPKKRVEFWAIKALGDSKEEYFEGVVKRLASTAFLSPTSQWKSASETEIIFRIISRFLNSESFAQKIDIRVENDAIGRKLLTESGDLRIWRKFFENSPKNLDLIQEMLNFMKNEGDGKGMAKVAEILKGKGIEIDTSFESENIDFVVELVKNMKTEEKDVLIAQALQLLLTENESPKEEHFKIVEESIDGNFRFQSDFSDNLLMKIELDAERIFEISARFLRIFAKEKVEEFLKELQKATSVGIMEELGFLEIEKYVYDEEAILKFEGMTKELKEAPGNSEEYLEGLKKLAKRAVFLWRIGEKREEEIKEDARILMNVGCRMGKRRYRFEEGFEEVERFLKDGFEDELEKVEERNEVKKEEELIYELIDSFKTKWPEDFLIGFRDENYIISAEFTPFIVSQQDVYRVHLANYLIAKSFLKISMIIFESEELMDFMLCGLVTVFDSLYTKFRENPQLLDEEWQNQVLLTLYLKIFARIEEVSQSEELVGVTEEWREFYEPTIIRFIFQFFNLVNKSTKPSPFLHGLIEAMGSVAKLPEGFELDSCEVVKQLDPDLDAMKYTAPQQQLILNIFDFLDSEVEDVQILALTMAKLIMPKMFIKENTKMMVEEEGEQMPAEDEKKLKIPEILRKRLEEVLNSGKMTVLYLFDVSLVPFEILQKSDEHRMSYCNALSPIIRNCLTTLLLKFPENRINENEYFLKDADKLDISYFDRFLARLLFKTMAYVPAEVRLWYKSLPNNVAGHVKDLITKKATKLLVERELDLVRCSKCANGADPAMTIRVYRVSGEIVTDYVVDETRMTLTIVLPADYPLSVPTLSLDKAIVKSDRAKKWLLQLNAYLFHQNGTIFEGIEMWRKNVDKGVEGAEACTICMMTIHSTSHQLPKVKCKQCKNKFHSNCLYKWFESSSQSSCPLCRANFT